MEFSGIDHFKGTHYEMGLQQGRLYKDNIKDGMKLLRKQEEFKKLKPKGVPSQIFWRIAKKKAIKWLKPYIQEKAPNQAERIRGIAKGADLSEEWIYLLISTELLLDTPDYEMPEHTTGVLEHCTDIGISKERSVEGETVIARNFDYAPFVIPFLHIRKNQPTGCYASIDITASPLPGTFNGLNEKGVFLATNEISTLEPRQDGLAGSILIQEALENCATTQEVVDYLKKIPRGSTNAWIVADANDDIRIIEYTQKTVYERKVDKNISKGWIVETNHSQIPELQKIEIPIDAVFGIKSPPERVGIPIGLSTVARYKRATEILENLGEQKISTDHLFAILSDHSTDPENRYACLCRHDKWMSTGASMIIRLQSKDLLLCLGNPCEKGYQNFTFDD
ncbi:MAG: C45 family autoproteolytic acyltransferase/hydrolase [Promethearchaeota archaeon]